MRSEKGDSNGFVNWTDQCTEARFGQLTAFGQLGREGRHAAPETAYVLTCAVSLRRELPQLRETRLEFEPDVSRIIALADAKLGTGHATKYA